LAEAFGDGSYVNDLFLIDVKAVWKIVIDHDCCSFYSFDVVYVRLLGSRGTTLGDIDININININIIITAMNFNIKSVPRTMNGDRRGLKIGNPAADYLSGTGGGVRVGPEFGSDFARGGGDEIQEKGGGNVGWQGTVSVAF